MLDEVRAACDFGAPSMALVGFSRGSAMTLGVASAWILMWRPDELAGEP